MDEFTFARELATLHPRAPHAWARDVGQVPAGDGVKIAVVAYKPEHRATTNALGHVQALPTDGTPGTTYKAQIDEHGEIRWLDASAPVKHEIKTKGGKPVGFRTEVKLLQLPRMQGRAEQVAIEREIAARHEAHRVRERQEALAVAQAKRDRQAYLARRGWARTADEEAEVQSMRLARRIEHARTRLEQRARGHARRIRINQSCRLYGLRPVLRWGV